MCACRADVNCVMMCVCLQAPCGARVAAIRLRRPSWHGCTKAFLRSIFVTFEQARGGEGAVLDPMIPSFRLPAKNERKMKTWTALLMMQMLTIALRSRLKRKAFSNPLKIQPCCLSVAQMQWHQAMTAAESILALAFSRPISRLISPVCLQLM